MNKASAGGAGGGGGVGGGGGARLGLGRQIQLTQGRGSSARQSHDGPGSRACEREQVPLQVARPSLHPSTPPSLNLLPPHLLRPPHPNHDRLKVCSMYLKSVVRVYAAPAALLQLHLRVKILLVLLHDVRQVRAPAALCVVLLTVAVVVVMVLRGNRTEEVGKRSLSGRDQLRLHSFTLFW